MGKIKFRSMTIVSVLVSACSTSGTGVGDFESPERTAARVTLVWKSDVGDRTRGTISGTLPDGYYKGRYFEVTKVAKEMDYAYAWEGWHPYWSDWRWARDQHIEDWPHFVTIYTGRVIANLKSENGKDLMRCRFTIEQPTQGLAGGGTGECQSSNGQSIDNVVLSAQ